MRTEAGEERYRRATRSGNLKKLYEEDPIADYTYWRIVKNRFSHNKLARINHMLVLKRECSGLLHIRIQEWVELLWIILEIYPKYNCMLFNFPGMSSIKNIPHIHLYILKKEFK